MAHAGRSDRANEHTHVAITVKAITEAYVDLSGRRATSDCVCGGSKYRWHPVADASDTALGSEGAFSALKAVAVGDAGAALERDWREHASVNHCQIPACAQAAFSIGWRDCNLNFAGSTS